MKSSAEDPLLRSARREAICVTGLGILSLVYSIGYCSYAGYERPIESITFILGFPDWVFWGVIAPWAVCTIVACYFSYVLMEDHDLEVDSALYQPPAMEEERNSKGEKSGEGNHA